MATGYELIYDIKEKLSLNSDDTRFSNEFIMFQIDKTRAALLKRNYSKGFKVVPDSIKQHIQLDLESITDNEFGGDDTSLRTSVPVPFRINTGLLELTSNIDGGSYTDLKFIKIPIERFPYAGIDNFCPTIIYCAINYDHYLVFKSLYNKYKLLSNVRVYDVFLNPEEAWKLSPSYDENTDFWDTEYPLDSETFFEISNIIVQQLSPSLGIPEDKINDADSK